MLTSIPGSNCWTKAEDRIADHLASLLSVQTFLGVNSASDAKAGKMYSYAWPRPADNEIYTLAEVQALMPAILLGTPGDDEDAITWTFRASGPAFARAGMVEMQIWKLIDSNLSQTDDERTWQNEVGDIVDELTTTRQLSDVQAIGLISGRNMPDELSGVGEVHMAIVNIRWGVSAEGGV